MEEAYEWVGAQLYYFNRTKFAKLKIQQRNPHTNAERPSRIDAAMPMIPAIPIIGVDTIVLTEKTAMRTYAASPELFRSLSRVCV
jgi:hypothetical protein